MKSMLAWLVGWLIELMRDGKNSGHPMTVNDYFCRHRSSSYQIYHLQDGCIK